MIKLVRFFYPESPRDHAGRRFGMVPITPWLDRFLLGRSSLPVAVQWQVQAAMRERFQTSPGVWLRVTAAVVPIFLAAPGSIFALSAMLGELPDWAWFPASVATVMLVFPPMVNAVCTRHLSSTVIAKLLDLGHCPSCGYTLTQVPASPDELTTCPECSASWRMPERHHRRRGT